MKRLTKLQRRLLAWIIALSILGSIFLGLRQQALSNLGYSAWTYLQYGLLEAPLKTVTHSINDLANLWHQYDDNQYLKEQLALQKSYQTMYQEEANKNAELEKLLKVKDSSQQKKAISARVLLRQAKSFDQQIVISAGKKDGIKPNMLVSTSEGAVGIVIKVQTLTSTVQLLTASSYTNDLAVKVSLEDGTNVEGVIQSYDVEKKAYKMALLNTDTTLSVGQQVATSGMGGNYPSGIYVGTVSSVLRNDDAIVDTVYVSPVSNIASFEYCLVTGGSSQ